MKLSQSPKNSPQTPSARPKEDSPEITRMQAATSATVLALMVAGVIWMKQRDDKRLEHNKRPDMSVVDAHTEGSDAPAVVPPQKPGKKIKFEDDFEVANRSITRRHEFGFPSGGGIQIRYRTTRSYIKRSPTQAEKDQAITDAEKVKGSQITPWEAICIGYAIDLYSETGAIIEGFKFRLDHSKIKRILEFAENNEDMEDEIFRKKIREFLLSGKK